MFTKDPVIGMLNNRRDRMAVVDLKRFYLPHSITSPTFNLQDSRRSGLSTSGGKVVVTVVVKG